VLVLLVVVAVVVVVVVDVTVVVDVSVVETVVVFAGAVTVEVGWLTVTCVLFPFDPVVTVEVVVLPPRPAATEMMNATARPAMNAAIPAIHGAAPLRPLKLCPHDGQNWAPAGTSDPQSGQRRGSSDGS
jgi:hypothetical protein